MRAAFPRARFVCTSRTSHEWIASVTEHAKRFYALLEVEFDVAIDKPTTRLKADYFTVVRATPKKKVLVRAPPPPPADAEKDASSEECPYGHDPHFVDAATPNRVVVSHSSS